VGARADLSTGEEGRASGEAEVGYRHALLGEAEVGHVVNAMIEEISS